jgi:hypothetical protein
VEDARDEIKPRLLFQVDASTGIPISASLSPATKKLLKKIDMESKIHVDTSTSQRARQDEAIADSVGLSTSDNHVHVVYQDDTINVDTLASPVQGVKVVEIPVSLPRYFTE